MSHRRSLLALLAALAVAAQARVADATDPTIPSWAPRPDIPPDLWRSYSWGVIQAINAEPPVREGTAPTLELLTRAHAILEQTSGQLQEHARLRGVSGDGFCHARARFGRALLEAAGVAKANLRKVLAHNPPAIGQPFPTWNYHVATGALVEGKGLIVVDSNQPAPTRLVEWWRHPYGGGDSLIWLGLADRSGPNTFSSDENWRTRGIGYEFYWNRMDQIAAECLGGACPADFGEILPCFAAGTPVLTESGPRPIEMVTAGDRVWALDPATGERALRPVARTFAKPAARIQVVRLRVGDQVEDVRTTAEHPFFVRGVGWVGAARLAGGMELVDARGEGAVVLDSVATDDVEPVFNLEVEELHDYFVGRGEVLVHNDCEWRAHGRGGRGFSATVTPNYPPGSVFTITVGMGVEPSSPRPSLFHRLARVGNARVPEGVSSGLGWGAGLAIAAGELALAYRDGGAREMERRAEGLLVGWAAYGVASTFVPFLASPWVMVPLLVLGGVDVAERAVTGHRTSVVENAAFVLYGYLHPELWAAPPGPPDVRDYYD